MKNLKPLLLNNPRAWRTYQGGKLLEQFHGIDFPSDTHFPEEWIASTTSARNAGREHVKNEGLSYLKEDAQKTLLDCIESSPDDMLGKKHVLANGVQMGVLVKLIDSSERLSIQVHPDKAMAKAYFNSNYGKTECWHILGGREIAGEKPCIYFGFKPGITRAYWIELFEKQDIDGMLSCLHKFPVEKGDTFLIEGGLPHAIGAGCFLVEIQEPTDYTIRVERTDAEGNPIAETMCHQGLGFEKMFDCFDYQGYTEEEIINRWKLSKTEIAKTIEYEREWLVSYSQTPYFAMEQIICRKKIRLLEKEVFSVLYTLEGQGKMICNGEAFPLAKGMQYFVPANCSEIELVAGDEMRIIHCLGPKII